ncbi:MAG: AAA family ATPase [Gammaproteobacteria bacterium]|nr:AAA family ATPase [Gammaproteobacteria bacterium]
MELKADQVEISTISDAMDRHASDDVSNVIDINNNFSDPVREQRINLLLHLIHYADLLLLSSPEGAGKTTLLTNFVERMGDGWQIHRLQGAALAQETSLSNRLADIFGSAGDGHVDRVEHLINHIPRLRRLSKPIILIIDDAEKLTVASMLLLDKMLAAGDNYSKPVHIILSGRSDLDDTVAAPELAGLLDRVAHRLDVPPFSESNATQFIKAYVDRVAADKKELFNAGLIKRIYRRAEGYPGQIIGEIDDTLKEMGVSKAFSKTSSSLSKIDAFDKEKVKKSIKALSSRPLIFGAIALGVALAVSGVLRLSGNDAAESAIIKVPVAKVEQQEIEQPVVEPTVAPTPAPEVELSPVTETPVTENVVPESAPVLVEAEQEPAPTPVSEPEIVAKPTVEIEIIEPAAAPIIDVVRELELPAEAPDPPSEPVVEQSASEHESVVPVTSNAGVRRDDWLLEQDPNYFTLQLMAANNELGVIKFIEDNGLTDDAAYFFSERDGNPWYAVTYGSYPSRSEANAVTLPSSLGGVKPWVRTFGGIHNAIHAAR